MSDKSTNNKQTDKDNKSGEKFTPSGPKPKVADTSKSQMDITGSSGGRQNIPRNPDYQYDSLGNVKGQNIPEYNVIKDTDDLAVRDAKMKAQQSSLPCAGPKPKYRQ